MMSWEAAAWLLLGGSTVLMFCGLPVGFAFLLINLIGAYLFMAGEAGLSQLVRSSVSSITTFSLTPIPLFVLMGEVLFHTGLAVKVIDGIERIIRHVPGRLAVVAVVAGTVFSAISGSTIATTAMLGSLMVPIMLSAGLSSNDGNGAHHGDRRGRYADSAQRACRSVGKSLRHFDLQAPHRGSDARHHSFGSLRGLDHPAHVVQTGIGARQRLQGIQRMGEVQPARTLRDSAGFDLRPCRRCDGGRLGNADGIRRDRRFRDDRARRPSTGR